VSSIFLDIVTKTNEKYVLPIFPFHITCMASFDVRMPDVDYDTFAMVVNFINSSLQPTHVTLGYLKCKTKLVQQWKTK
jgi:hypothetical protein